jgi:hypothetical protein
MNEYTLFLRVPGAHPRWHAFDTIVARSRPDALRRAGYAPTPRQSAVVHGAWLRMAHRSDRIDFDHRNLDGAVVIVD